MPTNWRIYNNHTLAGQLDRADLPGFFRKKIVVGPTEAAIVVRDGRSSELITSAALEVADLSEQVRNLVGLGEDISVYFVDLAPFDVSLFIGESTSSSTATDVQSVITSSDVLEHHGDAKSQLNTNPPKRSWWRGKSRAKDVINASGSVGWTMESDQLSQSATAQTTQRDVSRVNVVALSADNEVMQGACRLRFRVNQNGCEDFVGLIKGRRCIATWDLAALLRDEVFAKVFIPEIALHSAAEFRGNRNLLDDLEARTRDELAATLEGCGLCLESFSISWGLTEHERSEIARQRADREEAALEFSKKRHLAQLQREREIEKTRIENMQELKVAQTNGDEELKKLLLAGDIERDLMVTNKAVDVALVDARIRDITLEVERKESIARLQQRRADEEFRLEIEDREFQQRHQARLAGLEAEDKEMWSMVKMQIEMATQKHERELSKSRQEIEAEFRKTQADIEDRYQQRKLKLDESMARMGMMERLVAQGLQGGQADASVLNTLLKESTEQEYATTSDNKVRSRSEASAAGQNVETYRTAQTDERAHQVDMTQLSAEMMHAAKQSPTPIVATPPPMPVPQRLVAVPNVPAQSHPSSPACPKCGEAVQSNWKACPACAASLAAGCPSCGADVQPNWKACPACGESLGRVATPECSNCGKDVQANWKACPECGITL